MASHSTCSKTSAGSGVLSIDDVLYEILLRLSAKELCRLRLVCRRWRSLLSDPQFIAAHATRHPPLIVVGYTTSRWREGFIADIIDHSGCVVKRIRATESERVKFIQHDLICTTLGNTKRYRLLNPATGAVQVVPGGLSEQHEALGPDIRFYWQLLVFGHVASTGEYKLLRVNECSSRYGSPKQLCEVFTHNGSNRARWWRGKKAPPSRVKLDRWGSVVVDGTVYFLSHEPCYIPSFDLETENWKQTLRGPPSIRDVNWGDLSVATLNGCLVVAHHVWHCYRDLWFLMDIEKGLWVKKHSIHMTVRHGLNVHPLLVLDDGKIVLVSTEGTLVITYDPRTKTSADMAEMRDCVAVGLFTGSLVRLAIGRR